MERNSNKQGNIDNRDIIRFWNRNYYQGKTFEIGDLILFTLYQGVAIIIIL